MNSRRSFLKTLAGLGIAPTVAIAAFKDKRWPIASEDPAVNARAEKVLSGMRLGYGDLVWVEAGLPIHKGQVVHIMPDFKAYPAPTALDYSYSGVAYDTTHKGELLKAKIG